MTAEEWIEFLRHSIESHDRQIGELTEQVQALTVDVRSLERSVRSTEAAVRTTDAAVQTLTANIQKLVDVSNQDATDIAALARIAEAHERRLNTLERHSS